ncbi:MAG: hypothetical protein LBN98_03485 [Prevotellaceae bacterium]|jgi:hypothetical protein|nr:hypothetical protein [Prevotellaceae bacterium]
MSRIFEINYKRLVLLLLPTFLRKELLVAFLRAATAPEVTLHNSFLVNRKNNLYRLRMNGQVCYLRKVLNDAFPEAGGGIWIEDGEITGHWVYAWDDDQERVLLAYDLNTDHATRVWDEAVIMDNVNNFIVFCPEKIRSFEIKIKSVLNTYKLLSKSYNIRYYE